VTSDRLDEIKTRAEAATPGPWNPAIAPHPDSAQTHAEYLVASLCNEGRPLWVAWAENPTDDGFAYVVPAVTGDGPTSEANADFVAHAREDVPWLIAEVERLREIERRTRE
jgi:hypothetical protein